MSVPWGDVSTAFYTTGIPNIEVFVPAPPKMIFGAKMMNCFRPVLNSMPSKSLLNHVLKKRLLDQMRNSARKYPPMFGEKQEIRVGK